MAELSVKSGLYLTATGTTQATAYPIPASWNSCLFSTVAAGTGCVLPSNFVESISIYNGGADALSIYPPVGGYIRLLAQNTAFVLGIDEQVILTLSYVNGIVSYN